MPVEFHQLPSSDAMPVALYRFDAARMAEWESVIPMMKRHIAQAFPSERVGKCVIAPRKDGRAWVVVPVYLEDVHVADVLPVAITRGDVHHVLYEEGEVSLGSMWIEA